MEKCKLWKNKKIFFKYLRKYYKVTVKTNNFLFKIPAFNSNLMKVVKLRKCLVLMKLWDFSI